MTDHPSRTLATVVRAARQKRGLSARDLAAKVGAAHSSIVRLEQGTRKPKPPVLSAIAETLGIEVADLYALAGYTRPTALPSFSPYLRSKYGDLPPAAQQELDRSFESIARKYGYDADGPAPGEDESD